ncbi:MAG: hypothetical protein L6R37_004862 [Teloschistes peruensis]|nr:MAG: hypothetical protein L6R37_004862 [Teloschistes peruensis]
MDPGGVTNSETGLAGESTITQTITLWRMEIGDRRNAFTTPTVSSTSTVTTVSTVKPPPIWPATRHNDWSYAAPRLEINGRSLAFSNSKSLPFLAFLGPMLLPPNPLLALSRILVWRKGDRS